MKARTVSYTVKLDKPAVIDMQVEIKVGHITTEDGDLIPVTEMVSIPAGQTEVIYQVSNTDDNHYEGH